MSENYARLKELLLSLFQLDKPDLDFGIYRVMHAKAADVDRFLTHDLLPQVRQALAAFEVGERDHVQAALAKAIDAAVDLGLDPDQSPKVAELRGQLDAAEGVDRVEAEVFDLIARFFSRYYSDGDFISLRRYSDDNTYAIPYNGEEVLLHWANHDQYYVKTSEHLHSYSFRLRPDDDVDPMRVTFRLIDADEGAHGNLTESEAKGRVFVLASGNHRDQSFASEVDGELMIDFEFRSATMADWSGTPRTKSPPRQADLTAAAVDAIGSLPAPDFGKWTVELARAHRRADGSESELTVLQVQLDRYVKKNTFDYFVHKDLGGFLRRELDFFIKNEVMELDDIELATAARVDSYLGKLRAVRQVAGKIIDFLAQLEDFQRKLWLKKKFVVDTSYLVALGLVAESFYPEICANEAQVSEWAGLLGNDRSNALTESAQPSPGVDAEFLRANPTLTLNTALFEQEFTDRLVEAVGGPSLDDRTDGLLIQADNFQAMSLLGARFADSVDCFYLDPPYNTDAGPIDYKNGYRHSSWLASLADRLELARDLLRSNGNVVLTIDDYEGVELSLLLRRIFGADQNLGTAVIRNNPSGRPTQGGLSVCHEYAYFFTKHDGMLNELERTEAQRNRYATDETGELVNWQNFRKGGGKVTYRTERPKQYYPLFVDVSGLSVRVPVMTWDEVAREWTVGESPAAGETALFPIDDDGNERIWSLSPSSAAQRLDDLEVRADGEHVAVFRKHRPSQGVAPRSWWGDPKYGAREHGTAALKDLFGVSPFSFAKSPNAVADCLVAAVPGDVERPVVVDFFAGSGTTAAAVIGLNREDGGARRFVLVEGQTYFDDVVVPRVRKLAFTSGWEGGAPVGGPIESEMNTPLVGVVKILRLESYEDTLNNLDLRMAPAQQVLLSEASGEFREDYMLRYQLDVEARGSASLFSEASVTDPDNYELVVRLPSSDEAVPRKVDLIETFNWLAGITVHSISVPRRYRSELSRDHHGRLQVENLVADPGGSHSFRTVRGVNPEGSAVLIVWRNRPGGHEPAGIETDNTVLNAWFAAEMEAAEGELPAVVYVNGDSNLGTEHVAGATVRRTELEFQRLMFADSSPS